MIGPGVPSGGWLDLADIFIETTANSILVQRYIDTVPMDLDAHDGWPWRHRLASPVHQ